MGDSRGDTSMRRESMLEGTRNTMIKSPSRVDFTDPSTKRIGGIESANYYTPERPEVAREETASPFSTPESKDKRDIDWRKYEN